MDLRVLKRSFVSLLCGFVSAVLFLLLSAWMLMRSGYPDRFTTCFGEAAIFIGALSSGLLLRKSKTGLPAAFVTGALYALILFLLSLIFGRGSGVPLGTRTAVFAFAALLCGVLSALPSKARSKRKSRVSRNKALGRYFDRSSR